MSLLFTHDPREAMVTDSRPTVQQTSPTSSIDGADGLQITPSY